MADSHHNHIPMRDGEPLRDWLVWFAHAVAMEDTRQMELPGSSWCLMLRKEEAHAVLDAMNELVLQ